MKQRWLPATVLWLALFGLLAVGPGRALAAGPSIIAGQYIAVLRGDVSSSAAAAQVLALQFGLRPERFYEHALKGFSFAGSPAAAQALAHHPMVAWVEPDLVTTVAAQTLPAGVNRIEADLDPIARINGVDERVDVDIAILDTGIDWDHPDLNVYSFANFIDSNNDDGHGHGTHVAGTTAALDNSYQVVGVAPGARLWAVKVLGDNGSGSISALVNGIDYVAARAGEIEVANMSLSATGRSDSLRLAIANCVKKGVFFAVAAGNSGRDVYGADGTLNTSDDTIPAAYPEVCTVSAMGDSDGAAGGSGGSSDDALASFSNFSTAVAAGNPVSSPGRAVDVAAPGVSVLSTYKGGGTAYMSGTSMASPHVAGTAALYFAAHGRDTNSDGAVNEWDTFFARQALINTGQPQSEWRLDGNTRDPDGYRENLAFCADGGPPPNQAPSVAWASPTNGATVSGNVSVQISASDAEDAAGTLAVQWRVDGGSWQAAAYNAGAGRYVAAWDTTAVADGSHSLEARAADSAGLSASHTIGVTVRNAPVPSMHVAAIDLSFIRTGRNTQALANTAIASASGAPVSGASVRGDWYVNGRLYKSGVTATTDTNGVATLASGPLKKVRRGDVITFTVTSVAHASMAYDPAANAETSDSITMP